MKIGHKINHGWVPDRTDPAWAARVEREAEATTKAAERAYRRAQARLEKAEARLRRLSKQRLATIGQIAVAEQVVELRRQELLDLHRQMNGSPSSTQHRGRRSHRGVPSGEVF